MSYHFSKLDLWWVDSPFFKELNYKNCGLSISIIKVIIAISFRSEFYERTNKVSYSKLEEITGLSRPMISKSIKILLDNGLINFESKKGITNYYKIVNKNKNKNIWTKLPNKKLPEKLSGIGNRGHANLTALKIYLLLLKNRDNKNKYTLMTHSKLRENGYLRADLIKKGNDILLNNSFINYERYFDISTSRYSSNKYIICDI